MGSLKLCNKADYKIAKSYYAIGDNRMGKEHTEENSNEECQDDSIKEILDGLIEQDENAEQDREIREVLERLDNGEDLQCIEEVGTEQTSTINTEDIPELIFREKQEVEKKKKHIKINVGTIIAVCMLAIAIAVIVPTAMKQFGNYSFNKILQNSMYPTLKNGDILIMEDCSMMDIEVGDIITYTGTLNGKTVDITHRVISKEDYAVMPDGIDGTIINDKLKEQGYGVETALVVKGDNNQKPDDTYVTENMIRGRIVYDLGSQIKIVIILVIAIVIVSNIISILITILNRSKDNKNDSVSEEI